MKRFISLLFGLLIVVVTGTLIFLVLDQPEIARYQQQLLTFNWFWPTLWTLIGMLLVVALGLIIFALKPSHKKRGLYLRYPDGEIYLNKKSIEKNVQLTLAKYDDIRQPSIDVTLYQTKKASYMDVAVSLLVAQTSNVQTLLETIREDVKASAEHFSELPVREVKLNVLDQKALNKRVI